MNFDSHLGREHPKVGRWAVLTPARVGTAHKVNVETRAPGSIDPQRAAFGRLFLLPRRRLRTSYRYRTGKGVRVPTVAKGKVGVGVALDDYQHAYLELLRDLGTNMGKSVPAIAEFILRREIQGLIDAEHHKKDWR